jgi:outer membrane protein assembly factor BamA
MRHGVRTLLIDLAPRAALAVVTALASCRATPSPYPAVATPCAFNRIGEVRVAGAPREVVPQLAVLEGTYDDPERTERITALATTGLRARGYATATIAVVRRPGCGVDLGVAVTLGPRYRIARISFQTDDEFPNADRLAVLEDALGTVNTLGGVYIEYRMRRALAELERRYHDAGWLDARLGAPRTTYSADGAVAISVPVAAGRRFRIGTVKASGAGPLARATVLQTLGLRAGDYYDGPSVRTAIERARHKLARWVELRTNVVGSRPEIHVEAIVEARR